MSILHPGGDVVAACGLGVRRSDQRRRMLAASAWMAAGLVACRRTRGYAVVMSMLLRPTQRRAPGEASPRRSPLRPRQGGDHLVRSWPPICARGVPSACRQNKRGRSPGHGGSQRAPACSAPAWRVHRRWASRCPRACRGPRPRSPSTRYPSSPAGSAASARQGCCGRLSWSNEGDRHDRHLDRPAAMCGAAPPISRTENEHRGSIKDVGRGASARPATP